MLKIALIGHDTRNDNLGVGALTVSEVEIIREIAKRAGIEIMISILVGPSTRPSCVTGPDVTERLVRPLRHPMDFLAAIRDSDLVIDISGGDSFTDIYTRKRIFQILMQKHLVHMAGRPLVMAPQTVGPFNRPIPRYLASRTIEKCEIVAARDEKSISFLKEMGISRELVSASDVALRLPYASPKARPDDRICVGLNVSGLLMKGGYSHNNMFGLKVDYQALVREIIERFLAHPDNCELHLVGHVISWEHNDVEDDYLISLKLAEEYPEVVVAPAFETPSEAKSYIAGLDFFMGARMHTCIAAFSTGVPVVPMAYSRKFSGLFGTLGYDYTVDCTSDSADGIMERIFAAYETRGEIAAEMRVAFEYGLEKLGIYEAALFDLICRLDRDR